MNTSACRFLLLSGFDWAPGKLDVFRYCLRRRFCLLAPGAPADSAEKLIPVCQREVAAHRSRSNRLKGVCSWTSSGCPHINRRKKKKKKKSYAAAVNWSDPNGFVA